MGRKTAAVTEKTAAVTEKTAAVAKKIAAISEAAPYRFLSVAPAGEESARGEGFFAGRWRHADGSVAARGWFGGGTVTVRWRHGDGSVAAR